MEKREQRNTVRVLVFLRHAFPVQPWLASNSRPSCLNFPIGKVGLQACAIMLGKWFFIMAQLFLNNLPNENWGQGLDAQLLRTEDFHFTGSLCVCFGYHLEVLRVSTVLILEYSLENRPRMVIYLAQVNAELIKQGPHFLAREIFPTTHQCIPSLPLCLCFSHRIPSFPPCPFCFQSW
jgi:hypothetical protein